MTIDNLSGTGIGRLSGFGERRANEKAIEAAEKRMKTGRHGTHEGKRKPKADE